MNIYVILTLSAIASIAAAFIPSYWELSERNSTGRKRLTTAGYAFFFFSIFLLVAPPWSYFEQSRDQEKQVDSLRGTFKFATEHLAKSFDTAAKKLSADFALRDSITKDILAKYGFREDTVNHKLERIIDSLKRPNSTIESPTFNLISVTSTKQTDKRHYALEFISYNAACTVIQSDVTIAYLDSTKNEIQFLQTAPKLLQDASFAANESRSIGFSFSDQINPTNLYLWVIAKYKAKATGVVQVLDEVYIYSEATRMLGTYNKGLPLERMKAFLKNKGQKPF